MDTLKDWTRRGPDIRTRLDTLIARLIANGTLTGNEHNLIVQGKLPNPDIATQRSR